MRPEEMSLEDLLSDFRYWNEKTGKPLGSERTHEANQEMARRLRELGKYVTDLSCSECEVEHLSDIRKILGVK